ncbi:hypothetical protein [Chrysiogenes arsenatis]|uniref:hypothetical protein n=1 Tax=Chrysiogenes arsenatis TaxID=309797 RepID=UPI00040B4475|nr:hypothetical protein [Chrysiogenes arsenatis]
MKKAIAALATVGLIIGCGGGGGSGSGNTSLGDTQSPTATAITAISGNVADGYLFGSQVNLYSDFTRTSLINTTTTDAKGRYSFDNVPFGAYIEVTGGRDTFTGFDFDAKYTRIIETGDIVNAAHIHPLTTLLAEAGDSRESVRALLNRFGDVQAMDIADTGDTSDNSLAAFKFAVHIHSVVDKLKEVAGTSSEKQELSRALLGAIGAQLAAKVTESTSMEHVAELQVETGDIVKIASSSHLAHVQDTVKNSIQSRAEITAGLSKGIAQRGIQQFSNKENAQFAIAQQVNQIKDSFELDSSDSSLLNSIESFFDSFEERQHEAKDNRPSNHKVHVNGFDYALDIQFPVDVQWNGVAAPIELFAIKERKNDYRKLDRLFFSENSVTLEELRCQFPRFTQCSTDTSEDQISNKSSKMIVVSNDKDNFSGELKINWSYPLVQLNNRPIPSTLSIHAISATFTVKTSGFSDSDWYDVSYLAQTQTANPPTPTLGQIATNLKYSNTSIGIGGGISFAFDGSQSDANSSGNIIQADWNPITQTFTRYTSKIGTWDISNDLLTVTLDAPYLFEGQIRIKDSKAELRTRELPGNTETIMLLKTANNKSTDLKDYLRETIQTPAEESEPESISIEGLVRLSGALANATVTIGESEFVADHLGRFSAQAYDGDLITAHGGVNIFTNVPNSSTLLAKFDESFDTTDVRVDAITTIVALRPEIKGIINSTLNVELFSITNDSVDVIFQRYIQTLNDLIKSTNATAFETNEMYGYQTLADAIVKYYADSPDQFDLLNPQLLVAMLPVEVIPDTADAVIVTVMRAIELLLTGANSEPAGNNVTNITIDIFLGSLKNSIESDTIQAVTSTQLEEVALHIKSAINASLGASGSDVVSVNLESIVSKIPLATLTETADIATAVRIETDDMITAVQIYTP